MQSLKWPKYWHKLTPWQRVMIDFPFVGVRHRAFKELVAQMKQRKGNSLEWWKRYSLKEQEVAQRISQIASEELGWPNCHFLPSDAFEIIMWDGTGDLATAAAFDRIEKEFGLRRKLDSEWLELASHDFGYVVQKITGELAQ